MALTPPLEREDRLRKHPFAGFGMVMEDIKRTWHLSEKTRFLCFYIIKSSKKEPKWSQNTPKSDFRGPKIHPQRCEFNMKHVVLYVGHMYKPF